MARVEKNQPVVAESVAPAPKRRIGWKAGVALVLLAGFLVLAGFVTWIVAATGLVEIPVVSGLAYRAPVPTRVVGEGVPFETVMAQAATASFLTVPEATLTTELRDFLRTNGQTLIDSSGAQAVASARSGVELYLPLRDNAQDTAAIILLSVSDADGVPKIRADRVFLGSWEMGGWLRDGLANPALQAAFDAVVAQAGTSVVVEALRVDEGSLVVKLGTP